MNTIDQSRVALLFLKGVDTMVQYMYMYVIRAGLV